MAEMKMVLLTFVSKVNCKQFVIRIGVITKKRKKKFTKKMSSESFSDDLVIGGAATPSLKLERNSVVHVQIVGNLHPTKSSKDKDQYLLPVQKSGVWRDFVVLPAVADDRKLTELIFRRDSRSGTMLHTIFLDLNGNQQEEVSSAVSPGKRSLRVHDVDVGTQTELHVAYSEATYLLKPPGDSLKRNLPVKLRREVAKVSPSPSGSFSIRLDDVDEEADNASPRSDDQDDTVRDYKKEACEKLLSKQRLLKLVQELAPAEAFNLIVGLEVPEVKKKQEEHQEKNVVAVYFNLLVYWLEKMMGNKKKEAFDKLYLELKDVRQDLAESFQKDLDEYCQVSACANV